MRRERAYPRHIRRLHLSDQGYLPDGWREPLSSHVVSFADDGSTGSFTDTGMRSNSCGLLQGIGTLQRSLESRPKQGFTTRPSRRDLASCTAVSACTRLIQVDFCKELAIFDPINGLILVGNLAVFSTEYGQEKAFSRTFRLFSRRSSGTETLPDGKPIRRQDGMPLPTDNDRGTSLFCS